MILDERGKKYLLKEDCEFQSDLGIVTKEQIANCEIGDELKSHLDHTFKIVKPTVNDFIDLMDRRCSILLKLKTKILRKESMNKTLIWSF